MLAVAMMTPAHHPVSGFPLIVKARQLGQHAVLTLPQEPQRQGGQGEDEQAAARARARVFVEVSHAVFHRLVDPFLDVVRQVIRDLVFVVVAIGVEVAAVEVVAHEATVCPGAGGMQGVA